MLDGRDPRNQGYLRAICLDKIALRPSISLSTTRYERSLARESATGPKGVITALYARGVLCCNPTSWEKMP